ncbi:hypothetical protein FMN50_10310 [Rhodobacterales bacterium]|nr:hypothetical protein FMN50_10310 [Rhodobacterales bacterium]
MKKLIASSLFAVSLLTTSVSAETVENWSRNEINGYMRYWTRNKDGSNFVVWCHPTKTINGTLIHIEIDGKTPTPGTRIKMILDKDIFELPVNGQGYIGSDCATCADSFDYVWHRLRSSHFVAVKFKDERYAHFSLRGAKNVLPGDVCPTDWHKSHPGS